MTALIQLTHSSCRNASTNAILPLRLNLSKAWKSTSIPPSLRNSAIHSGELVWSFVLSPEKFRRHEELSSRTQSSAETSVEMEKFSSCSPSVVQLNCWRSTVHLFATLTPAITDNRAEERAMKLAQPTKIYQQPICGWRKKSLSKALTTFTNNTIDFKRFASSTVTISNSNKVLCVDMTCHPF